MTKEQIIDIYNEIINRRVDIILSDELIGVKVIGFIDESNLLKVIDKDGCIVFIDGNSLDFIALTPEKPQQQESAQ